MYSTEELNELKEVLEGISTHIPEHKLGYIWNNYNKLQGGKAGPQPCACSSASKYWRQAINDLKAHVKSNG
jgi:hypothetical protein